MYGSFEKLFVPFRVCLRWVPVGMTVVPNCLKLSPYVLVAPLLRRHSSHVINMQRVLQFWILQPTLPDPDPDSDPESAEYGYR